MKKKILQIPIMIGELYEGEFDISFKKGNELTNDWEVISFELFEGVKLAIYNREVASILIGECDIEFHWNKETRNMISNFNSLTFMEFFKAVLDYNNKIKNYYE